MVIKTQILKKINEIISIFKNLYLNIIFKNKIINFYLKRI